MHLILGGRGQGKFEYAVGLCSEKAVVADLGKTKLKDAISADIISGIHMGVRNLLALNEDPVKIYTEYIDLFKDKILIGDEIGSGIVPVDSFDRKWRDETGRVYVLLSNNAERVDRMWAGCVQKLKG